MKKRLTYVPKEIVRAMPIVIAEGRRKTPFTVSPYYVSHDILKIKTHQFDILSILKLLHSVKKEPLGFSRLYEKSQIRMKKSFLNYLHLVEIHGFMGKIQLEKGQHMPENPRERVSYNLTDKGRLLLGFFGVD